MTSNSIQFYSGSAGIEVLRLSKDGIWANPEIPADEAAQIVLNAIDYNIKVLVQKAVEEEREACAQVTETQALDDLDSTDDWPETIAKAIRARGEK